MDEFLRYEVCHVMSKPVTVGPDICVAEVQELLEKTGYSGVPVVWDGGTLVGFVTSLDVLKAFRSDGESTLPDYGDIMRRPVYSIMQQNPATVMRGLRVAYSGKRPEAKGAECGCA
jgi:CBS domain-containing protein